MTVAQKCEVEDLLKSLDLTLPVKSETGRRMKSLDLDMTIESMAILLKDVERIVQTWSEHLAPAVGDLERLRCRLKDLNETVGTDGKLAIYLASHVPIEVARKQSSRDVLRMLAGLMCRLAVDTSDHFSVDSPRGAKYKHNSTSR